QIAASLIYIADTDPGQLNQILCGTHQLTGSLCELPIVKRGPALNRVAVTKLLASTGTKRDSDVFLAQEPFGFDRSRRILSDHLAGRIVELHFDCYLVLRRARQNNPPDRSNAHAAGAHWRPFVKSGHVIEWCCQPIRATEKKLLVAHKEDRRCQDQ